MGNLTLTIYNVNIFWRSTKLEAGNKTRIKRHKKVLCRLKIEDYFKFRPGLCGYLPESQRGYKHLCQLLEIFFLLFPLGLD